MKKSVSLIIPAYNEEANLPCTISRISEIISQLEPHYSFEIIVLDNASTDRTGALAKRQCQQDSRWKYLRYSRNFGAEASMLAGLDHASGDAVINVFSDLQDPPELIPQMLAKWESGADVVYGVLRTRNDASYLKTIGARIAYKLIRRLADTTIPENATDFRLLDRKVVDALRQLREPDRYLRGLVHWLGFRTDHFVYDRAKRQHGQSSANVWYCFKFTLQAIICFSSKPMHLAMYLGVTLTSSATGLALLYFALYFIRPAFLTPPPPGLTTVLLLSLFSIGINALLLGIIGEYIGKIYNQGKQRPLYIIAESIGLPSVYHLRGNNLI